MPTTSRGVPYPAATDANDVPADLQELAEWVDARPGVSALTSAARDALVGADLWDGRLIVNLDNLRTERYDLAGASWKAADEGARTRGAALTDATPSVLSTWTNWGASLNLGASLLPVFVTADVRGSTLGPASVFRSGQARVGISLDSGVTYTWGPTPYAETDGTIRRASVAASHYAAGTPTGDVRVQVQVLSTIATDYAFGFGHVTATLTRQ